MKKKLTKFMKGLLKKIELDTKSLIKKNLTKKEKKEILEYHQDEVKEARVHLRSHRGLLKDYKKILKTLPKKRIPFYKQHIDYLEHCIEKYKYELKAAEIILKGFEKHQLNKFKEKKNV